MERSSTKNGAAHIYRKGLLCGMSKREIAAEGALAMLYGFLGFALSGKGMLFETYPLGMALLCACGRQTPAVLLGASLSAIASHTSALPSLIGYLCAIGVRMLARLFIDSSQRGTLGTAGKREPLPRALAGVFSEHAYLRMNSAAIGAFAVGTVRIIIGGFRFYDLFAAIFSLIVAPAATLVLAPNFIVSDRRMREGEAFSLTPRQERTAQLSSLCLACAFVYSLNSVYVSGASVSVFVGLLLTLAAGKRGILRGVVCGLALGVCISPSHAPLLAFCSIAYSAMHKLSQFGAAVASCVTGLAWSIYIGGVGALGVELPSLLCASMLFFTAEKINLGEDLKSFFSAHRREAVSDVSADAVGLAAQHRLSIQEERLRTISDSFASLSEIFYNLSSKLKRPSMLDLRNICESGFERVCASCEMCELCYGAEYGSTLDATKKLTVQLYRSGVADEKKLPESFKLRCNRCAEIVSGINRECAIETKRALKNEKTEIFALDYDAVSRILNDAIAENEEELKSDPALAKRIARAIADEGYGEHGVVVIGKRKLRILAHGLDLSDKAGDVGVLKRRLEEITHRTLTEPQFQLSSGCVNMQIESKCTFSAESAFCTASSDGEKICGDTVSIFENKDGYMYALISDGMGTGREAALASEMCGVFLKNMLTAGNGMETSLRMLNSVLRAKGSDSEAECSATVDLMQLDLHTGEARFVKSGAAPTLVLRRGNVFKLSAACFPIGILRAIDARQIELSCEDGDVLVMMSDGATDDGDGCERICELLSREGVADEPPSKICDRIMRETQAERSENKTAADDISVVALRIRREMRDW